MKVFKIATAALVTTLLVQSSAQASDRNHRLDLNWSEEISAAENFESADRKIATYCRAEAKKAAPRDQRFAKDYRTHCIETLRENYVAKIGQSELTTYYAFVVNPVKKNQFFAKR